MVFLQLGVVMRLNVSIGLAGLVLRSGLYLESVVTDSIGFVLLSAHNITAYLINYNKLIMSIPIRNKQAAWATDYFDELYKQFGCIPPNH